MDFPSIIKQVKEDSKQLDQDILDYNTRIKELNTLLEAKKTKKATLDTLKNKEAELLKQLESI